jgi:hypothetical protein
MTNIKSFCLKHSWPDWTPVHDIIQSNVGEGEYQKVAIIIRQENACLIYFPDNSSAKLDLAKHFASAEDIMVQWYNPVSGSYAEEFTVAVIDNNMNLTPPNHWPDAILILKGK